MSGTQNPKYYQPDGVHLTLAGYELTAGEIARVVNGVASGK